MIWIPRGWVVDLLAQGTVVSVLEDFMPRDSNFVLYYPNRRNSPAALRALVAYLRKRVG
jgi:DNA-binding transcriptional LysR family regulator